MPAASNSQKIIARGVGSNAFSFVIRFAAKASFLYVGARLYGAANYGVFALGCAIVELAVPVASLGLKRMIFPWLEDRTPHRSPPHVLLDAMLLALVTGSVVVLSVVVAAMLIPGAFLSDQLRFSLLFLAPAIIGQSVSDIALAVTRWKHRMRYEVIGRGLLEPYTATAVALLAWFFGIVREGLLIGYCCGTAALTVFALYGVRHCLGPFSIRSWRPDIGDIRKRIRHCSAISLNDVINGLTQRLDFYLVGFWLGAAQTGTYSVLRELRTSLQHIRNAFDSMLIPIVARTMRYERDTVTGEAIAAATRLIVAIQLVAVLVLIFYGKMILGLFGKEYVGSHGVLIILVIAQLIASGLSVSDLIIYFRQPGRAVLNNLIMISAMTAFMAFGVRYGLPGVALSVLGAASVAAIARKRWLVEMGIRRSPFHIAAPVIAAALSAGVGLVIQHLFSLWPSLPPGFATLFGPLIAIALYASLIAAWIKHDPDAISLGKFRTNAHE